MRTSRWITAARLGRAYAGGDATACRLTGLGAALLVSFLSGVLGLWVSDSNAALVVWAHGAAGMAVIVLVWSKLGVIRRGLRRRRPPVGGPLAAGGCAGAFLGFGLAHSAGL